MEWILRRPRKNTVLQIRCSEKVRKMIEEFKKDKNLRTWEDVLIYLLKQEGYWREIEFK